MTPNIYQASSYENDISHVISQGKFPDGIKEDYLGMKRGIVFFNLSLPDQKEAFPLTNLSTS